MKFPLVIISMSIVLSFVNGDYLEQEDWIDPGDMISYDPVLKQNVKKQTNKGQNKLQISDKTLALPCQGGHGAHYHHHPDHGLQLFDKKQKSDCKCLPCPKPACEKKLYDETKSLIFVRRFVAFYMNKLSKVETPTHYSEYEVFLGVSSDAWKKFEKFCENSSKISLQEVLLELEATFHDVSSPKSTRVERWKWKFEDFFHTSINEAIKVAVLIMIAVGIVSSEAISKISWRRQIIRLLILMFFVSYIMKYILMYQQAVAEHKASPANVPKHCKDSSIKMTTLESFLNQLRNLFSFSKDPCVKYHESFLVWPGLHVPPFKVLVAIISESVFEPFEHLGTAISRFAKNTFSDISVMLFIPTFFLVIILVVAFILILSVSFGYSWKLRLPFWSGFEITPSSQAVEARHHQEIREYHRQQIESMQNVINALQEGRPQPALDGGRGSSWMSSLWGIFGGGNSTDTEQTGSENEAPSSEDANNVQNGGVTDVPVSDFPNDFEGLRHRRNLPYPPSPLYPTGATVNPPDGPLTPTTYDYPSFVDNRSQFDSMERSYVNVDHSDSPPASEDTEVWSTEFIEIGFRQHILEGNLNAPETVQRSWPVEHGLVKNVETTVPPNIIHNEEDNEQVADAAAATVADSENEADVLPSSEQPSIH